MHPDLARSLWSALLKNAPQPAAQHQCEPFADKLNSATVTMLEASNNALGAALRKNEALVAQLAEREALLVRTLPYLSNTPDLVQHGAEDLAAEIRSASTGRPCYGPNEWGTECGKCSKCKGASAEPSAPVESDFSKQKHDAWRRAFYGEDSAPVERDERAEFEAWYLAEFYESSEVCRSWLRRDPVDESYIFEHPCSRWKTWQARAALERKA